MLDDTLLYMQFTVFLWYNAHKKVSSANCDWTKTYQLLKFKYIVYMRSLSLVLSKCLDHVKLCLITWLIFKIG